MCREESKLTCRKHPHSLRVRWFGTKHLHTPRASSAQGGGRGRWTWPPGFAAGGNLCAFTSSLQSGSHRADLAGPSWGSQGFVGMRCGAQWLASPVPLGVVRCFYGCRGDCRYVGDWTVIFKATSVPTSGRPPGPPWAVGPRRLDRFSLSVDRAGQVISGHFGHH